MKTFSTYLEQRKLKKTHSFSSVLFHLPPNLSKDIISWGEKNVSEEMLFTDPHDPGYGREDEIHCTVLYGLHANKSNEIRDLLKNVKPFKVQFKKISLFKTSPKFDVIKIEVESKPLHKINGLLKNNMEVTNKFPEYKPHVTIAYLNKNSFKKRTDLNVFNGTEFVVNSLIFSSRVGTKTPIRLNT